MSSAIFLYFSDYNKLKLIYTLASPAKASQLGGASWTVELQDCLPSPACPAFPSPAKAQVHKGALPSPGCQPDPSAASKEKGKEPEDISDLQLGRKSSLAFTVLPASTSVGYSHFWTFFPLKAPGVLGEMRLSAFGIRKKSATQNNTDPQERPTLNSEVSPIA